MDTTPPSSEYLAFVDEVQQRWPDVDAGHMFGVPNLKRHRRAFAGGYAGGAVFRLPDQAYETALRLDDTTPFDPSGRGTPMGTWVVVPATHSDRWMDFARASIDHLEPTPKVLKKGPGQ